MDDSETTKVFCSTTSGDFTILLHKEWSPNGYDRLVELFGRGFYDGSHFFRVVPNFLVQFGISYSTDQDLRRIGNSHIQDDPKHEPPIPFREGIISFAGSGPNSRSSQIFISYGSAPSLGRELWETPVGEVINGMENVRELYSGYGDMPPWGKGPLQGKIHRGPKYIEEEFPLLDSFKKCNIELPITAEEVAPNVRLGSPEKQIKLEVDPEDSTSKEFPIVGGTIAFFIILCAVYSFISSRRKKMTKTT